MSVFYRRFPATTPIADEVVGSQIAFQVDGNGSLTNRDDKEGMDAYISTVIGLFTKAGLALLLANEVRGFAVAAPVLYGMYRAGGAPMAVWLGICSMAGIALSVMGPMLVARKLKLI